MTEPRYMYVKSNLLCMSTISISVTSGNKLYKFKIDNVLSNNNSEYCVNITLPLNTEAESKVDIIPPVETVLENKSNESQSRITQDTSCSAQERAAQTGAGMQEENRSNKTTQLASGTRSPDYERKRSAGSDIPVLPGDNVSDDVGNNADRMDKEMVDYSSQYTANSTADIIANRVADDALDALDLIEYKFAEPSNLQVQTNLPQAEQKYPVPKNISALTSLIKSMQNTQPNQSIQLSQPTQPDQLNTVQPLNNVSISTINNVSPPAINNVHDYIKSIAHTAGDPSRQLRQIPENIIPIDNSSSYVNIRKMIYLELFTDMDSWLLNRMNSLDRRIVRDAIILDKDFSRLLLKFVRFIDKAFYANIRYMFQGNLTIFERRLRGILLGETGGLYTLVLNVLCVPDCKCDYCSA